MITYATVYALTNIERFTGADGKTYGPYTAGESMTIPQYDAERLIRDGKASYSPPVMVTTTSTVTSTTTSTVTSTVTTTIAAETITVPTLDVASVAGAGIVALIIGVAVGWFVGSRKKAG
jgi:hypothetical protein